MPVNGLARRIWRHVCVFVLGLLVVKLALSALVGVLAIVWAIADGYLDIVLDIVVVVPLALLIGYEALAAVCVATCLRRRLTEVTM